MKIRIAILAACATTFALAQVFPAQAAQGENLLYPIDVKRGKAASTTGAKRTTAKNSTVLIKTGTGAETKNSLRIGGTTAGTFRSRK